MRYLLTSTEPLPPEAVTELLTRSGVLLAEPRAWLIEARSDADAQAWARRCGAGVEVQQIS